MKRYGTPQITETAAKNAQARVLTRRLRPCSPCACPRLPIMPGAGNAVAWPGLSSTDRQLQIRSEREGDTYAVRLVGELDLSGCEATEKALLEAEASDAPRVLIDIDELTFVDSQGLRVILPGTPPRRGRRRRASAGNARARLRRRDPAADRDGPDTALRLSDRLAGRPGLRIRSSWVHPGPGHATRGNSGGGHRYRRSRRPSPAPGDWWLVVSWLIRNEGGWRCRPYRKVQPAPRQRRSRR